MTNRSAQRRVPAQRRPGIDWDAEQREFEGWYKSAQEPFNPMEKNPSGFYTDKFVDVAWASWKKARNTIPKVSFK